MFLLDKLDDVQKKIIGIYVFIVCVGILIYMLIHVVGLSLNCPLYQATGLYCPGCGITRSGNNFMHFNFYHSFRDHPGFFVGAMTWVIISILAFIGKPKCFRNSKVNLTILYVTMGLYIVFSVLRNIPGFEFLQPIDKI